MPPLAVMAAADVIMGLLYAKPGFYPWVYGSYILYVLIGRWLARNGLPQPGRKRFRRKAWRC